MPATDQYWRNLNSMHKVFLGSTLLFAAASLWMIAKDSNREWRDYQVAAEQLRLAQARTQIANIEADPAYQKELAVIEAEIAAADAQLASEADQAEEARLLAEIDRLTGDYTRAARRAKFERAGVDKDRSLFDIDYRDSRPEEVLDGSLQSFMDAQVVAGLLSTEEQVVKAELDQAKGALAELNKARDDAIARKVKLNLEKSRLQSQIELIDPTNPVANFKRTLKDQQVIDSFNPTHKIQFDWPQRQGQYIKVQLGMASVNRVDRCRSCHIHITEFGAGNVPNFPKGTGDDGGYSEPFCSHPNPDLYLSSTSPHKVEEFGCTVCHGGDGSGTSFQNAEHTPSNPGQAQHWANDFGWHSNHFWEYPMLSKQFVESSCLKCHHQVMELGVNEKFGASAPKLFEGYNTLSKYGCFGCHPVNGFNGSHQIGPDLRLEPQTAAEALAIANDPNQVAGQMRKVGPSLRHVSQKSPTTFLANWTAKPSDFRPNTPMPLFFDLANQQDHLAMALQPVELVAISKYLEAKSTPIELLEPKEGYVPDVERGKQALAKSGCLACHTHDDEYFKGIQQDFGPNLTRVHEKINPGKEGFNWLYTWLREPTRHHPRTKMPNLYLEGVQQGDEYIDPAADIAQFLLDGGPREFKQIELPGVYLGVVTESTDRGLEVTEILAGGPAQRAQQVNANGEPALSKNKAPVVSLRMGDVIATINGAAVSKVEEFTAAEAKLKSGEKVSLTVLRGGVEQSWQIVASTPMEDLVRLYLSKSLSKEKVNEVLTNRQFPIDAAFWKARPDGSMPPASQFVKGDEVELLPKSEGEVVSEEEWYNRQMQYLGRRTISRYGCYGCHDIEGFDEARPIGTALQDWGRKDTSKLAFEHIEEYLHHHGEPDGSSTMKAVEEIVKKQYNDGTATPEEQMKSLFFASLQHHGREGFLWQKLRAPRSYDHKKIETKGWDERLRMPKFPFNDHQIEAVATFVLGLVAEPPAPAYVYQPDQRKKDIIEGERLLAKFNCTSCHMMRTPGVKVEFDLRELLGGASRQELVSWFRDHGQDVLNGTITQAMLVGDEPIPDAYIEQQLANVPPRRRDAKQEELQAFYGGMSLFLNNSIMLLDGEKEGIDLSSQLATRLAQLGQTPGASGLQQWLDARPEVLVTEAQEAKTHPEALRLDFKLRPPVSTGGHVSSASVKRIVELHGMMSLEGDQTSPLDEQLYAFEVWEPTEVGGRYIRPKSKPSFNGLQLKGRLPARGGQYMQWLATHLAVEKTGDIDNVQPADINLGYQSGPPLLYKEGIKVQTPWLFDFLKNPGRIRYLTVLRMPQFNMSSEEAQALANYFAAVDGAEYPYQQNERREPDYLRAQQAKYLTVAGDAVSPHGYMGEAWKLLNADKCITCHEVGGREYVVVKDSFRGPDLKNVELRLRPDWALLWVFNPEAVTPYTSMPANIMKTPVAYPHLLGGDPTWQNNALIDALMNHSRDYMSFGAIQYDPATNQTTKAGVAVAEAVDAGATPSSGEGTDAAGSATPATPATPETPTKTETEAVPSGTPETATDAANAAPAEGAAVDGQSVNEPNAATATEQSK